uniref:Uncharacterized protein n=1 Tax=Setaria italica TaxID=4555 RepID=K3ZPN4_SETIT
MPAISESHRRNLGNEGSLRKGVFLDFLWKTVIVFLKKRGTCTNNFQEVKLFSSLWSEKGREKEQLESPVLCILLVLSSLNSQTCSS